MFLNQKHLPFHSCYLQQVAASYTIKHTTLLTYCNFCSGYNHMCYITVLYVTHLKSL